MAKINLLPWRQELNKQRQQEFLVISASVALTAAAIVMLFHVLMSGQLSDQEERKAYIQSEIATLDGQIKQIDELQTRKEELLARMKVIQDLQGRRPVIVRVYDEIAHAVPDKIYLTSFQRTDDIFTIEGSAESNTQVSAFLRNLNASTWFKNPVLANVTADETGTKKDVRDSKKNVVAADPKKTNRFALKVELESPEPSPEDDKAGVKKINKEATK